MQHRQAAESRKAARKSATFATYPAFASNPIEEPESRAAAKLLADTGVSTEYEDGIPMRTSVRRLEVERMKMRGTWIKSTVLLLGMTLGGAALMAQQATTPAPEAANQSTASATGKLQLTLEQKKQLRDLRASARDQAAIIRHDQALSAGQKQGKLKALRASTREQMKSVLTPEQQNVFAQRRAEAKARVAAKLGLTSEQQGKLKELAVSTHQQRQSVLTNPSLGNEQKQAQLSQIRLASKAQLATILTPEQLARFQQMRRAHRHSKLG